MHVYSHSPTSERPGILAPMHLTLLGVQRKQMQAEDIWENGEFVQVLALRFDWMSPCCLHGFIHFLATDTRISAWTKCAQVSTTITTTTAEAGLCGKLPPSRVWDVAWRGNPSATDEYTWNFQTPWISSVGHIIVEPTDYFTLTKVMCGTDYQLKHYGSDGYLKTTFPKGKVKSNSDVVFYLYRDWYATVITKEKHKMGDTATFSNLQFNRSASFLRDACMQEGCTTTGSAGVGAGHACIFPFIYEGITHHSCGGSGWCATETDEIGRFIGGKWGRCSSRCFQPICEQTTQVGCLGDAVDDCKPFKASCVNGSCVCNSGYCAASSIRNGVMCEAISVHTTATAEQRKPIVTTILLTLAAAAAILGGRASLAVCLKRRQNSISLVSPLL
mmetsp:Transcript_19380/g.35232  ORF Transcript_19380/g.35232 Transcript_19380/m.35232 type:complete len:388 (-) Transcript_19380:58-1221(-)